MKPRHAMIVTSIAAIGLLGAIASGAPQGGDQRGDAVAEEVRQLRLSLERAAETSTRISVAMQRSNLVEARLSTLSWELVDIRSQLARASSDAARLSTVVSDYESQFPEIASDPSIGLRMPQYGQAKGQLAAQLQVEQALRSRESQVAASLQSEQAQWNELAERIAAIERSLGGRRN
jgi:chromosome segregation ATPase